MHRLAPLLAALALLLAAAPARACQPAGAAEIRAGRVGADVWAWWPCVGDYAVSITWRAVTAAELPANAAQQALAFVQGRAPNLLDRPLSVPPDDPAIAHLWRAVQASVAADADLPPAPRWVVAANGTLADRPMYAEPGGTAAAGPRAPVGAACDCAQPQWRLTIGAQVRCPLKLTAELAAALGAAGADLSALSYLTLCTRSPS